MTDDDTSEKKNRKWKPCPECGSQNVKKDKWTIGIVADVVCQNCGNKESAKQMHAGRGQSEPEDTEEPTDSTESGPNRTPQEKLFQNLGMFLIVGGILVSLTLVGAIIGIPMIIIGMVITVKGGSGSGENPFECHQCGEKVDYDAEQCPECEAELGGPLDKFRANK